MKDLATPWIWTIGAEYITCTRCEKSATIARWPSRVEFILGELTTFIANHKDCKESLK